MTKDNRKKTKSDARIAGEVATYVLLGLGIIVFVIVASSKAYRSIILLCWGRYRPIKRIPARPNIDAGTKVIDICREFIAASVCSVIPYFVYFHTYRLIMNPNSCGVIAFATF